MLRWVRQAPRGLRRLWRRRWPVRVILVAVPLASVLLGVALVVFFMRGGPNLEERRVSRVLLPSATATPTPTPVPPSEAPPTRLVIPKIGVDAPLEMQTVPVSGVMPMPSGPEVVAWYDMSTYHPGQEYRIGFGGNAILSGHVDYIRYGPAVFWDLGELQPGDEVQVHLGDGTLYRYAVAWNEIWPASAIPWDRVFEINERDAVTLVTCGGSWDGHDYSDRRAVRAERIYTPPAETGSLAPGG
jgi:LPXTG-site transpeptidase (sortase) family protein